MVVVVVVVDDGDGGQPVDGGGFCYPEGPGDAHGRGSGER